VGDIAYPVTIKVEICQSGAILQPGEVDDIVTASMKVSQRVKVRWVDGTRGFTDVFSNRCLEIGVGEVYRLLLSFLLKISDDGIVVVYGDGSCGVINVGDGTHIASPVDKTVAADGTSHQVNHCSTVICESPCPGVATDPPGMLEMVRLLARRNHHKVSGD